MKTAGKTKYLEIFCHAKWYKNHTFANRFFATYLETEVKKIKIVKSMKL
jgi:hypothetical protein